MKKIYALLLTLLLPALTPCLHAAGLKSKQNLSSGILFQVSSLESFAGGDYAGTLSFAELQKHGDFGLGTFDGLDGEMLGFDGRFYQVNSAGAVRRVKPGMSTPIAFVTYFKPKHRIHTQAAMSCQELYAYLDLMRDPANPITAIKITGEWQWLKTRSVRAEKPPFRPLPEVIKDQVVFKLENVKATLVGFWMPPVMEKLNVTGYHFHALNEDRNAGGHVLDCQLKQATIEMDTIQQIQVLMPAKNRGLNRQRTGGAAE